MLYFALVEFCLRPSIAASNRFLSITNHINRHQFGLRMCAEHASFSTNAPAVDEWYKCGLKFKCTECGHCCSGTSGSVRFNENEGKAIANRLNVSFDKFLEKYSRLNRFNEREFKEVQVRHWYCKLLMGRYDIYYNEIGFCHIAGSATWFGLHFSGSIKKTWQSPVLVVWFTPHAMPHMAILERKSRTSWCMGGRR